MKLNTPYKVVGQISNQLTDAFLNKLVDDDWYAYDFRQPLSGMKDCNSILLRHSNKFSKDTLENMILFSKFQKEIENVLEFLESFYEFDDYVAFIVTLYGIF
jgi:hypothetical protein